MKVYSERTKFGLNWMQILIVAVAANLSGGLVFTLTEGLVPSWVVYPILLIIGLWMLHRRAITGALIYWDLPRSFC
jgi:xanthine/uracil/vitamin C permease (AzgA family)